MSGDDRRKAKYLNVWREDPTDCFPIDAIDSCTDFHEPSWARGPWRRMLLFQRISELHDAEASLLDGWFLLVGRRWARDRALDHGS